LAFLPIKLFDVEEPMKPLVISLVIIGILSIPMNPYSQEDDPSLRSNRPEDFGKSDLLSNIDHGPYQRWVARYNGPGNGSDVATAMALDAEGNVYVTGSSWRDGTSGDYATIKYDTDGNTLGIKRYNGPANGWDYANAVALDVNGNVYVTGSSRGIGTEYDYATIKYDTAGEDLWVARYNGPGNYDDNAIAIALDAAGNVYITGYSYGSGTSYDYDYATIKYDTAGNELWVARYNGPANRSDYANAVALDVNGNVYVTGESFGMDSTNYATIKYDTDGNELWVARYNGPEGGTNGAGSIALDADANVYVAGESWGGETQYDYAAIKYDTDGNELWVARYNGPGNGIDGASAMALDAAGNVYVTGASKGNSLDYATVKYDTDGNELWVARYNGSRSSVDWAEAISLDADGNIYVTGSSRGIGTSLDYATIKYDTDGNELWVARYNGPENGWDIAIAIALDADGSFYLTGYSAGEGNEYDYATIKYSMNPPAQKIPVQW
jgi:uncharacterized delta-60 repeat protein